MPRELDEAKLRIVEGWMQPFNDGNLAPLKELVHDKCTNYPVLVGQLLIQGGGHEVFEKVIVMLRKGFPNDLLFKMDKVVEVTPKDREYLLECFHTPPFAEVCPDDIGETIDDFFAEAGTKILLKATLSGTNEGPFQGHTTNNYTSDQQLHLLVIRKDQDDQRLKIFGHGGCRNDKLRARNLELAHVT